MTRKVTPSQNNTPATPPHTPTPTPIPACIQQASRDYCEGQPPHPSAAAAAAALGLELPCEASAAGAQIFEPASDIVSSDLVLCMDKFSAADVLREVRHFGMLIAAVVASLRGASLLWMMLFVVLSFRHWCGFSS